MVFDARMHLAQRTPCQKSRKLQVVHLAMPKTADDHGRLDRVSLSLSALLFVSPWLMGYMDISLAAKAAWISAIVIALASLAATFHFSEWEEWVNLFAGLWLVAAPWILGFHRAGDAVGAFVGIGVIVTMISLSELWEEHHPGHQAY
jgi:hypothetical protein